MTYIDDVNNPVLYVPFNESFGLRVGRERERRGVLKREGDSGNKNGIL